MCGRYVLVKHLEIIAKEYNLAIADDLLQYQSYNIAPSQYAPVWSSDHMDRIQLLSFGYIPFWQKTRRYLINARSEGNTKQFNVDNEPNYRGGFHIRESREFGKAIASKRCLVFANGFYEGPEKERLSKPYFVHMRHQRIFALGGICKTWTDKKTGEVQDSFVILTTYPNELMTKIGHHRTPVIIRPEHYQSWLQPDTPIRDIMPLLKPLSADLMNAYPVSTAVKNVRNNDASLILPMGEKLYKEYETKVIEDIEKTGFGDSPARRRKRTKLDEENKDPI